jgi:hypothetical protein
MRSILLTLLILLVQCAAITTAGRAATLETRESAVASVIAGAPVEVFCVSTYREWNTIPGAGIGIDGVARPDLGEAWLSPWTCQQLAGGEPRGLGPAALTLAHEAVHLSGIYDEARTECVAGMNAWRTLTLLGVRGRRRNLAYRAAMRAHADIATVPGYNWHGAC